jgi:L-lactate dehydrogenase complex protein LldG
MSTVEKAFSRALSERGVRVRETTAAEAPRVLEQEIEPPAVGASLDTVPVDLTDVPVEVTHDPTPEEMDEAATGITDALLGIADYGSVVLRGGPEGAEPVSLYPDRHLVVVRAADIVQDMETGIAAIADSIRDGHRSHVIATGPSATADMGELVEGAHGPRSVTVVVVSGE